MKIAIVYHDADYDGIGSAAIANMKLCSLNDGFEGKSLEFHGWNYGRGLPEISADKIYWLDCFNKEIIMKQLETKNTQIWVIDHHPIQQDLNALLQLYGEERFSFTHSMGVGAIELVWNHFCADIEIPDWVKYISIRDVFKKESPDWGKANAFQFGMRAEHSQFMNPCGEGWRFIGNETFPIIDKGKSILSYKKEQDSRIMKNAFLHTFMGKTFVCVNASGLDIDSFEQSDFWSTCEYFMFYNYMKIESEFWWTIGLRSKAGFTCNDVAQAFEGGGHPQACGFKIKSLSEIGL